VVSGSWWGLDALRALEKLVWKGVGVLQVGNVGSFLWEGETNRATGVCFNRAGSASSKVIAPMQVEGMLHL
jgi:hypothetical protein